MTAAMDLFLGEYCHAPQPLTTEELGNAWPRLDRDALVAVIGELLGEGLIRSVPGGGHVATELGRELWRAND